MLYTKGWLEGDEILFEEDPKTGSSKPIDRGHNKKCVDEYLDIILWCKKADAGVFILTHDDYLDLPVQLIDAYEIFKTVKAENVQEDRPVTVKDMVQMFGKKDA